MKTIEISKSALKSELTSALKRAGSTDWDVYVRLDDGVLDTRHNTHPSDGWIEIIDLYGADSFENDGKYPGDDGYNYSDSAEWIVDELGGWLPEEPVEIGFDDESMEFLYADFELTDD